MKGYPFDSTDIGVGDTTESRYILDSGGNAVFHSISLIRGGAAHWHELAKLHEANQDIPCPCPLSYL